jgi:hypothetical protein
MDKGKIWGSEDRLRQLITEIRIHWELEKCEGSLRLLELYEDTNMIYMVLEYQAKGTLYNQVIKNSVFNEK